MKVKSDEAALTKAITELAKQYGRYGYRRITALLKRQGWRANSKRIQRIWRQEGLKVPARQPKRGRLWLNDGSGLFHRTPMSCFTFGEKKDTGGLYVPRATPFLETLSARVFQLAASR
jgi:transposase InsO family protein